MEVDVRLDAELAQVPAGRPLRWRPGWRSGTPRCDRVALSMPYAVPIETPTALVAAAASL